MHKRTIGLRLAAPLAAAATIGGLLAGCGTDEDTRPASATPGAATSGAAPPSTDPTSAPQTVTATVTATAPPVVTMVAPPPAAPTPAPSSSAGSVGVLNAYFDAVNARDYARAWSLGGWVFAGTYAQFVSDHTDTAYYDLTVLSVSGSTVVAAMDVTHTDGRHHYYSGTYTVRNGAIAGTTMREVTPETPPPGPGQASPYYENCDAARDAGAAPITRGQPGYAEDLDSDHDGVACEPYSTDR